MDVKEEFSSTSFCSQNNGEVFNSNIVTNIKCEPIDSDIEAEIELKVEAPFADFYSQNEIEDPLMLINKYNKNYGIHTKVEVKEEICWSERILTEAASVYNEIKDGMDQDFSSSETLRSYTGVSSNTRVKSAIFSVEELGKDSSCNMRKNTLVCKSEEVGATETFSKEKSVYSEQLKDENIDFTTSCLKQDNLTQQNNIYAHDIDKNCATNSVTVRHNLSHASLKVYTCVICEKSFKWLSHLKWHILIHEAVKPYKCDMCKKDFARVSHLKQHTLIHESVRPYTCSVCEKGFTLSSNLKRHSMVHEYGKQHKCDICGKYFTQSSYLKIHNWIHQDRKPYKCDICEKSFIKLSQLKSHNLLHEGKKPFKCDICEKCFVRSSGLKRHILIHGSKKA